MDKRIKALWIAALESGEFEQGKGQLRALDNKFCCLGVLCELAAREGVIPPAEDYDGGWTYDNGHQAFLSITVQEWADLSGHTYVGGNLISDNDSGIPFTEIAEIIRENF